MSALRHDRLVLRGLMKVTTSWFRTENETYH
jgi:hypothetical protein